MKQEIPLQDRKNARGFSLMELAIVLVIVALVTGAVLTGRSILQEAKLKTIVEEINTINLAAKEFRSRYGAIPGDMWNAADALGKLSDGVTDPINGDGDGILQASNGNGDNEMLAFWQHLSLSGLLPGEYDATTLSPGAGVMPSDYDPTVGFEIQTIAGEILVTASKYDGGVGGGAFLTPEDAWTLDRKYDDGNPATGLIRAETGTGNSGNCITGSAYTLSNRGIACRLDMQVQEVAELRTVAQATDYSGGAVTTCPGGSYNVGDRRGPLPCPGDSGGGGETYYEICRKTGVWEPDPSFNYDCAVTAIACSAVTESNADWPTSNAGTTGVSGTCVAGYTGSPTRDCGSDSTWGSITGSCTQITCAATTESNADWPQSNAGTSNVNGTCIAGYTGSPTRNCDITGAWAAISGSCTQITCPATSGSNISWAQTNAGTTGVSGTCDAGYSGSPTRDCDITGNWGAVSGSCTLIACAALTEGNADWAQTTGGTSNVSGTCISGYTGSPTRDCGADGTWGAIGGTACTQIVCAATNESNADWAETVGGTTGVAGTCNSGYTGSPTRDCGADGTWGAISGSCSVAGCGSTPSWANTIFSDCTGANESDTCTARCDAAAWYWGMPTTITCTSGSWAGTQPTCFTLDCSGGVCGTDPQECTVPATCGGLSCSIEPSSQNGATPLTSAGSGYADTRTLTCDKCFGYSGTDGKLMCDNNQVWRGTSGSCSQAASPTFNITGETLVNTYTALDQQEPSVAVLADGGYVIVWESEGQDGDSWGIYFQRFSSQGSAVGSETQVNTQTVSNQDVPTVTALTNGGFVVAWNDYEVSIDDAKFRVYDASGAAVTGELTHSDNTGAYALGLTNGNFMIASHPNIVSANDILVGVYDDTGTAVGSAFRVNTYTSNDQKYTDMAQLTNGNVVVTWGSKNQDGSGWGVYGQVITTAGVKVGSEFRVNTYTTGDQGGDYNGQHVAALSNGGFVVVWDSNGQDGSGYGVYGQIFDATGMAVGSEIQINTTTAGDQFYPRVTGMADGYFFVVWEAYNVDDYEQAAVGQLFDSTGTKVGGERIINQITKQGQQSPAVATLPTGKLIVTWQSDVSDGSGDGVLYRFVDPFVTVSPLDDSYLKVWLKPETGITKDGSNLVGTWADQSGNGYDASQGTAAKKPLWVDNQINGYPVIRFDGTDDYLGLSNLTILKSVYGGSVFIVEKRNGAAGGTNDNTLFDASTNNASNPRMEVVLNGASSDAYTLRGRRSDGNATATLAGGSSGTTSFNIVSAIMSYPTTTAEIYVDGTQANSSTAFLTTGSSSSTNSVAIRIGAQAAATPTGYLNADIAEVLVFNRAVVGTDRQAVECYLADKYNLTLGYSCPSIVTGPASATGDSGLSQSNGYINYSFDGTQWTGALTCYSGYTLSGSSTATCAPGTGTWTSLGSCDSTSFSPASISGLKLWLDASDSSTITSSGGRVSQWNDKSGNGNNVTQSTAAAKPYTGRTINGNAALDFQGAQRIISANPWASGTLSQPTTIFMVHALDATADGTCLIDGHDNPDYHGLSIDGGSYVMHTTGGPPAAVYGIAPASTSSTQIVTAVYNSSSSEIYVDGALNNTGDVGAGTMSDITIGGWKTSGCDMDGAIGEILVYNASLSATDREDVECYLANKWGVSVSHCGGGTTPTTVTTPSDLTGLKLWLDGSDSTSITSASGRISQWRDKSGQGNHVNQSTAANKPYTSRTINGRSVVDLQNNQWMVSSDPWASGSLSQPNTFFIVFKQDLIEDTAIIESQDGSNILNGTSTGEYNTSAGGASMLWTAAIGNTTSTRMMTLEYNSTSSKFYVDGILADSGDADNNASHDIYVGGYSGSSMDGAIAEIIMFNSALSEADRQGVECYLSAKWGVTVPHSCPTIPYSVSSLKAWYDASDSASITSSSGSVSQWTDKSGQGNTLTQATASSKPYTGRTLNAKNALDFQNDDDLSSSIPWASGTLAQPNTVFVVAQQDTVADDVFWQGAEDYNFLASSSTFPNKYVLSTSTAQTPIMTGAIANTSAKILTAVANDSPDTTNGSKIYVNGTLEAGAGNTGTAGLSRFRVGDSWAGTNAVDGAIAEVIVFNALLSDADREAIECYLSDKWGITVAQTCP